MSAEFVQRYRDDLDDILTEMEAEIPERDGMVADVMPTGSFTPRGSDDGTTTSWADVQATLDERANRAASHPWFAANPHWAYGLRDGADAGLEYLNIA